MRKKAILTGVCLLLLVAAFAAYSFYSNSLRRQSGERNIAERMASLRSVLHTGMTRGEIDEILRQRFPSVFAQGLNFEDYHVLLGRLPSTVLYCSYEDVSARLQFNLSGPSPSPQDRLIAITEHRQSMDCL